MEGTVMGQWPFWVCHSVQCWFLIAGSLEHRRQWEKYVLIFGLYNFTRLKVHLGLWEFYLKKEGGKVALRLKII